MAITIIPLSPFFALRNPSILGPFPTLFVNNGASYGDNLVVQFPRVLAPPNLNVTRAFLLQTATPKILSA